MKTVFAALACVAATVSAAVSTVPAPGSGGMLSEQQIKDLVADMPLAVKIGQLTQFDVSMVVDSNGNVVPEKMAKAFNASYGNYVGSVINTPFSGCDCTLNSACETGLNPATFTALVSSVQEYALQAQKSAGLSTVPVLWGLDSVHGANYVKGAPIFPHNTGVAATMDPAAAQAVGMSAATWTRSAGIPWMFSPVLGLGMQPQWSRTYETFGEDPHVGATMGRAFVLGAQNDSKALLGIQNGTAGIAATAKHYFGYSYPVDGKDRTDAWIPDVYLKSYFEPAFQAAFDAGIMTTMINSGSVNGVPAHANARLLTDILRDQIGFRGVAVTDWQDIEKVRVPSSVCVCVCVVRARPDRGRSYARQRQPCLDDCTRGILLDKAIAFDDRSSTFTTGSQPTIARPSSSRLTPAWTCRWCRLTTPSVLLWQSSWPQATSQRSVSTSPSPACSPSRTSSASSPRRLAQSPAQVSWRPATPRASQQPSPVRLASVTTTGAA
jgi:beta-glucosidase-like glycosyl hydrolase